MAVNTECAESQETRVLPLLSPQTRAKHDLSKRSDNIPAFYAEMSGAELDRRITAARETLGARLVILGHHYQRDEIIKYADFRGDFLNWRNWPPHVLKPITSSSVAYTLWLKAPISSVAHIKKSSCLIPPLAALWPTWQILPK